jgi:hypothetical protein
LIGTFERPLSWRVVFAWPTLSPSAGAVMLAAEEARQRQLERAATTVDRPSLAAPVGGQEAAGGRPGTDSGAGAPRGPCPVMSGSSGHMSRVQVPSPRRGSHRRPEQSNESRQRRTQPGMPRLRYLRHAQGPGATRGRGLSS